ncbi:MAG TPA: SRPBCC family protein [Burkholderiaceae bacterium]|nr:SRPBCC family protein [Burkholderiaceae bacterium]
MNATTAPAYIEPVRRTIRVQAPAVRAFDVFTAGMFRWWPATHSINPTKAPIAEIVMEPRTGGRWYERGADGSECDWGRVLAWEPPLRILLAWQIDAAWKFDPSLVTEVEIRFEAQGPLATEVRLEHRKLDALGETAPGMRAIIDSASGWSGLLERYATEFSSP